MDALEEEFDLKIPVKEIQRSSLENTGHNPGLRALLSIKNFSATLKNDYARLLQIESGIGEVNNKGLLVIQENVSPEMAGSWKEKITEINEAVAGIKNALNTAKEKIERSEKTEFPDLWVQLSLHLKQLQDCSIDAGISGTVLLPRALHAQWEIDFIHAEQELVQSMVLHVDSCRVLLQMIKRYTPDELNKISKIIADQIPIDFTYKEAELYQKEYYTALINFKKEFKEEKNLWDKFLDILAGGTHQTPSERVMLERWIEGEKGELL